MNDVRTNEPIIFGLWAVSIRVRPKRNISHTNSSTGRPSQRFTPHSAVNAPNVPTQLCTSLLGRNIWYHVRFSSVAWSFLPVTMNDRMPIPSSAESRIMIHPRMNFDCSPRRMVIRREGFFGSFALAFFSFAVVGFFSLPIIIIFSKTLV